MGWMSERRAERRTRQERLVLGAIGQLRPEFASAGRIARLTYMSIGTAFATLVRLEARGEVSSSWVDGSEPRRRVYRNTSGVDA